jgi:hypothetical protein
VIFRAHDWEVSHYLVAFAIRTIESFSRKVFYFIDGVIRSLQADDQFMCWVVSVKMKILIASRDHKYDENTPTFV